MTAIADLKEIKLQDLKLKTPAELVSLAERADLALGELAEAAAQEKLIIDVALKKPSDFRLVGRHAPRHIPPPPPGRAVARRAAADAGAGGAW